MGRAKLEMELISKDKSRNTTFKKRKEGLIRKLHEFTTLCDVKACMIIYGPTAAGAEIWPQDPDQVRRIIDLYKTKNKDSGIKSYGVADFFHEREKKIEEELAKTRKKNLEAKYPLPRGLNDSTAAELRDFNNFLSVRIDKVKERIELLRRTRQSTTSQSHGTTRFEVFNHHHSHHHNQHNQQQMMMMNQNHALEMQVPFIDPNAMMMLPPPLRARYYAQPLPPLPQQYMALPAVGLVLSNLDGMQEPGYIQYQMRNQTPGSQN